MKDSPTWCRNPGPALWGLALADCSFRRVRPRIELELGCSDQGQVLVSARVYEARPDHPDDTFEGQSAGICSKCAARGTCKGLGSACLAGLVRLGTSRACARYALVLGSDSRVLEVLRNQDREPPGLLLTALDEVVVRHLREATPAVLRLLNHPSASVRFRTVGVLSALQDPRAIRPLARQALKSDSDLGMAAVRAIVDIGGPLARRALRLVATQARELSVSELAEELLQEVEKGTDGKE